MKNSIAVLILAFGAGCIEAPDSAFNDAQDMSVGETPIDMNTSVNCTDCQVTVSLTAESAEPPDPGLSVTCEGKAGVWLGAWDGPTVIQTFGITCTDVVARWDTDAFTLERGNNMGTINYIGRDPLFDVEPYDSICSDGWVVGVEVRTGQGGISSVAAVCADIRVRIVEREDEISQQFERSELRTAETIPPACFGDECSEPTLLECDSDQIATGVLAFESDGAVSGLTEIGLLCSSISLTIQGS